MIYKKIPVVLFSIEKNNECYMLSYRTLNTILHIASNIKSKILFSHFNYFPQFPCYVEYWFTKFNLEVFGYSKLRSGNLQKKFVELIIQC